MTTETQSFIVTIATLGATIISLIALYISIVSNRTLKTENRLQRILEAFLTNSYTEYIRNEPHVYQGEIAVVRYLNVLLISGEIQPLPVKTTLDACLNGLEAFMNESRCQLKREGIRQELQAINIRFITPLVEILNPQDILIIPPGVLDYFNNLSLKSQNIKEFIEKY